MRRWAAACAIALALISGVTVAGVAAAESTAPPSSPSSPPAPALVSSSFEDVRPAGKVAAVDEPCGTITEGTFGALAQAQVAGGTINVGGGRCVTVDAGAGPHLMTLSHAGVIGWAVTGPDGAQACAGSGIRTTCTLPVAATYMIRLTNQSTVPLDYSAALIDLVGTRGCEQATGTGWDTPTVTAVQDSPLQMFCLPFTGETGEKVTGYSTGANRIIDAAGKFCDRVDRTACTLSGAAPYRLLVVRGEVAIHEARMQVRRLSHPQGCPVVAPGSYGTAPAGAFGPIRCRALTAPATGYYQTGVVEADSGSSSFTVYDSEGKPSCTTRLCLLSAGTYTLVAGDAATLYEKAYAAVFIRTAAAGCVEMSEFGVARDPYKAAIGQLGELDCITLPRMEAGTVLGVLRSPDSPVDLSLVDANGGYECSHTEMAGGTCKITGPWPVRLLISADGRPTTDYALVVNRMGDATGCPVLSPAATVELTADRFVGCAALPAPATTRSDLLTFTGTGSARATVYDSKGSFVCGIAPRAAKVKTCRFVPGRDYAVVLRGDRGTYRVGRKATDGSDGSCQPVATTVPGGRASTGNLTADDDIRCYRVEGGSAFVHVRGGEQVRQLVTSANGATEECPTSTRCVVSGSGHHVFVFADGPTDSTPFELHTWSLARCATVPSDAYDFGPLTGTFGDDHTGQCVELRVNEPDQFEISAGGTRPYLVASGNTTVECAPVCGVGKAGFAYLMVTQGKQAGPYRVEAACKTPLCGVDYTAEGGGGSARTGDTATITLTGTGLHLKDSVLLRRAGQADIPAVVRAVSADRRTLTADVNLTGAAAGVWDVFATSYSSFLSDSSAVRTVRIKGGLTVTPLPLKATRQPSISGAVRVGGVVTAVPGTWTPAATAYAYQWSANGVAIKGAVGSAYTIPAALRGRKLSVTVTAKRSGYPHGTATSAGVTVGTGVAPKATTRPKVTGTVRSGQTVKVAVGAWSPRADSYRYEWRVDGKLVSTASSLKLTRAMVGRQLTVVVIAKGAGHDDGRATSAAVKVRS